MSDNSPQKGEAEGYVMGAPFHILHDVEIAVLRSDIRALSAALDETQSDLASVKADFAGVEARLVEADKALNEIRTICYVTHLGQARAHAALSQIDQIARKGLG